MDGMTIGIKNLKFAVQLTDTKTGSTYSTITSLPGISEATITPEVKSAEFNGDDAVLRRISRLSKYTIEISAGAIPLSARAALFGRTVTAGAMTVKSTDVTPFSAIMFESLKDNGKKMYLKFYKCMPEEISESFKSGGEELQAKKIKFTAIVREYDSEFMKIIDEEDTSFVDTTITDFYTAV